MKVTYIHTQCKTLKNFDNFQFEEEFRQNALFM